MRRNTLMGLLLASACLTDAAAAWAQEQSTVQAGDAGAQVQVDEIVVTASRRAERLVDVAGQVGAVDGGTLEKLKARNLADFAAFTPGVSFQSTSPGTNRVVIRGVTTGGSQQSSAIGLYVDDVPIGSSTQFGQGAQALNIGLFDLDRIEVLNGPQGTLYGANALGGTLKYITAAPDTGAPSGRIEAEGGHTEHGAGSWAGRAMANLPLGDDFALRAVGVYEDNGGFIDDPTHGRDNLGRSKVLGGRLSVGGALTPRLRLRLNAFGQRVKTDGAAVEFQNPSTGRPTGGAYNQSNATPESGRASLALVSGVGDLDLGKAKLTTVTAWQDNRLKAISDESITYGAIVTALFGPVAGSNPFRLTTDVRTRRFTQELRLASIDNKRLEWVVGGFYSREKTRQQVGLTNAASRDGYLFGVPIGSFDIPSVQRELALFGDATVYFSRTVDATIGVRQSWNKLDYVQRAWGLGNNPTNPFGVITSQASSDESTTTWLFNLRYRPTSATTVYTRAASGYRPGGPNIVFGSGSGNASFGSDQLWNYEVGVKQSFGDGRGLISVTGYQIDWSKIQLVVNVNGVNQYVNGGDARVRGSEFALSWRSRAGVGMTLSGAYTDAKLTTVAPALGVGYVGARLPLSPRLSLAALIDYRAKLSGGATADFTLALRHVGSRQAGYVGSPSIPLYRLKAYQTVDASVDVTLVSGWRFSPYIRNLFDVRGDVSAATFANAYVPSAPVPVTLSQPRTLGLTIGRSF